MIPKKCCRSCRNFDIDFKLDGFCSKYEDYDIDCERYKSDALITAKGKWINDGNFMITSCCNKVYGVYRFVETRKGIHLPKYCPNCGARMDWVEWANKADPSEYDPFADVEQEDENDT